MLSIEKVEECVNALKRDFDAAQKNLTEVYDAYLKLKVASRYLVVRQKGLHLKNTSYSQKDYQPQNSRYVKFGNDESIRFTLFNEDDFVIELDGCVRLRLPYGTTTVNAPITAQMEYPFTRRLVGDEKANLIELASASSEANQNLLHWKKRVEEYARYVRQIALALQDVESLVSFIERVAYAMEAKRDAQILSAFGVAVETKKPTVGRFTVIVKENGGAE